MDFRFILLPAIALPVGLILFLAAQRAWGEHQQSNVARQWLRINGRILSSGVRQVGVRTPIKTSAARYRTATRYAPHILYTYTVDERTYQSDRIRPGSSLLSSEVANAQRAADSYPPGSPVTVYYNPSNPSESVLEPLPGAGIWVQWAVVGILAIILIALVILILLSPPMPI